MELRTLFEGDSDEAPNIFPALALPTFRTGPGVVGEALDAAFGQYDAHLAALAALPEQLPLTATGRPAWDALPAEAIRVRRYDHPVDVGAMGPAQVLIDRLAVARLVLGAAEIEEPWAEYADESAAYLALAGMPKLAAFMAHVWRSDERRHGVTLRAIHKAITGVDVPIRPHVVKPVQVGARALEHHLIVRLNAEISAAAAYLVLARHTTGDVQAALLNLAGDELRHLAIFWAATKHRTGDPVAGRLWAWVRHHARSALGHRQNRTGMARPGLVELRLLVETGATLIAIVRRLGQWDAELSPTRLQTVFGPAVATITPVAA